MKFFKYVKGQEVRQYWRKIQRKLINNQQYPSK